MTNCFGTIIVRDVKGVNDGRKRALRRYVELDTRLCRVFFETYDDGDIPLMLMRMEEDYIAQYEEKLDEFIKTLNIIIVSERPTVRSREYGDSFIIDVEYIIVHQER